MQITETNSNRKKRFIVVAGNIGVGKSSLTKWLAEQLGYEPFFEPVMGNPYMDDFYADMKRWSFHCQVFFLSQRFEHHKKIDACPHPVIQDRSIYEDSEIFAKNLYQQGLMEERDYQNYLQIFQVMYPFFQPPDLLIYLKASVPTLMRRIRMRDRSYERSIPRDYIEQLNVLYDDWISRFDSCPKLVLPADDLDFIDSYYDFSYILDMIKAMELENAPR
ncbi:MAG: deoxynucleoside kinase [Bacteroidota bacterium]